MTYNIITDAEFDRGDSDFQNLIESVNAQLSTLDKTDTVLLIRIPDDFDYLNKHTELVSTISRIRCKAPELNPSVYVIGLQFDIECVESPNNVVILNDAFDDIQDMDKYLMMKFEQNGLYHPVSESKIILS